MHRGIGMYEGDVGWQGENEWEEGVGLKRAKLQRLRMQSRSEQPCSYEEQVVQLVWQTRSCTKAARTQAAPSARTSSRSSSDRGRGSRGGVKG